MVVFDVLFRVLRTLYDEVIYVRNITDIDDKIITASFQQNISFQALSNTYETAFKEDMAALQVCEPTYSPKATHFIQEMIALILKLLDRKYAYEADGHVLFSIENYAQYGQLSRKTPEELKAGARIEVAPYKKAPEDFVLWKPARPEEPGWESPWGRGRPGWHIECSAMSHYYLGSQFDIHAGGIDLIFPHHENERAQTCCASGVPEMARFWLHNGHLTVDGKKMSKSLGNFITVKDLLSKAHSESIRLSLLSSHYRQPLDWTATLLNESHLILNKWHRLLNIPKAQDSLAKRISTFSWEEWKNSSGRGFCEALEDDLNTPLALHFLNQLIQQFEKNPEPQHWENIVASGRLLGLFYQSSEDRFRRASDSSQEVPSAEEIEDLIEKRNQARSAKDFSLADDIRQKLLKQGIVLEDSPSGTSWRRD
jgi:cysteinyl-tRNA synthetase